MSSARADVPSGPAPPSTRPLIGRTIAAMSSHTLLAALTPEFRLKTLDFIDWLFRSTPVDVRTSQIVEQVCERLLSIGLPLDRYGSATSILTADHDAIGRVWIKDKGVQENVYVAPDGDDPGFLNSPFHEAERCGTWIELWLPETEDTRFGIVPELKQDGYTHYVCIPLVMPVGASGWVTMASKAVEGFSREHLMVLALIVPALGVVINMRVARLTLDRLLRTYVGEEPHRAILEGNVKRGQVTTIRSAILFADMRDSTGHTAEISVVEAVALFNDFFDCLVPPIEARGGEVLKYIGDGLLAIFRDGSEGPADGTLRALEAAKLALANVKAFSDGGVGQKPIEVGIALHYGEAAYGNVGSGLRLDFTVIGRDIGLASRIGGLNARLGEPLLMSAAFAEHLHGGATPIGAFAVRGFSMPVAVLRPH